MPSTPRGFTLIELLVVIFIIGLLSSIVFPVVRSTHCGARKVQCTANLKAIYTFAMLYADQRHRAYPIAPGTLPAAHQSLQTLVDSSPFDFEPELFVCPEGAEVAADKDRSGRLVLTADTCSYSWVARRLKSTTRRRALSSDKCMATPGAEDGAAQAGHEGGMNVVTTDGTVSFWRAGQLDGTTGLPPGLTR